MKWRGLWTSVKAAKTQEVQAHSQLGRAVQLALERGPPTSRGLAQGCSGVDML